MLVRATKQDVCVQLELQLPRYVVRERGQNLPNEVTDVDEYLVVRSTHTHETGCCPRLP